MQDFYASASPGTEEALCEELRELGFASVRLNRGGIPFRGEWQEGWRACLQSRIAQRIMVVMARFPVPTVEALVTGARRVPWATYLTEHQTFAVAAVCRGNPELANSDYAALKVKDAIADTLRTPAGTRPSVNRDDPDVRVFLYVVENRATLYLDLAGESLHRRGWRQQAGEAPLRETLAAVMLRLSGWDRRERLVDPMCGAGTIAIEAAQLAGQIAPGLSRGRFGFERWANFGEADAQALRALCGDLRRRISPQPVRIVAADQDAAVLDIARSNARAAGVRLSFRQQSVLEMQGDGKPGIVVTNPPYGVRLETEADFPRRLAATFMRLHGWRVCLLAGTPAYAQHMSLKPRVSHPLRNGDLECQLLVYDVP